MGSDISLDCIGRRNLRLRRTCRDGSWNGEDTIYGVFGVISSITDSATIAPTDLIVLIVESIRRHRYENYCRRTRSDWVPGLVAHGSSSRSTANPLGRPG